MQDARNYLSTQIPDVRILKLAETYKNQLILSDETYFPSVDTNLAGEYNTIINAYVLLFLRVQDILAGNNTLSIRTEAFNSYKIVQTGIPLAKNLLERYVLIEPLTEYPDILIYRTQDPKLEKALAVLEKKVLIKFGALLESDTITTEEYKTSVQAYDDFILHLMIYRNYGQNPLAKERALTAIKTFTTTYQKIIEMQP